MDKMNICHDTDEADGTLNSDQIKETLQKYAAQTERMREIHKKSTKGIQLRNQTTVAYEGLSVELTALLLINTQEKHDSKYPVSSLH